ncbi:hypothetical protein LTR50_005050 [Elasticomyces elasticus]|nr:hypothetical protein LTR50_005050 [Elasticomyces elasticus]
MSTGYADSALIPETELRRMARDVANLMSGKESKDQDTDSIKLLYTARLPEIEAAHRAAACNVICALIERCLVSPQDVLGRMIWDGLVWERLFEVFLTQHENAKAKSMRQVLMVLSDALLKLSEPNIKVRLQQHALKYILYAIHAQDNPLQAKAALHAISCFMSKNTLPLQFVLSTETRLGYTGTPLARSLSDTQSLLRALLHWVTYSETSPAAGQAVCSLVALLSRPEDTAPHDDRPISGGVLDTQDGSVVAPSWADPIIKTISEHPASMDAFRNHVFPNLFKQDIQSYLAFLQHLRLREHLCGPTPCTNSLSITGGEFATLLSSLQVGKDLGLVQEIGL